MVKRFLIRWRWDLFAGIFFFAAYLAGGAYMIMGSSVYFLGNDRSALSVASLSVSSLPFNPSLPLGMEMAFRIWTIVFPLGLLTSLLAVGIGTIRRSSFMIGLGLLPLVVPACR